LSYEPINKVAVRTTFIFQKLLVSSVNHRLVGFRSRRLISSST